MNVNEVPRRVKLLVGLLLASAACEPQFDDIYCLEPQSAQLPVCVARLGRAGGGGSAGSAGTGGLAGAAGADSGPGAAAGSGGAAATAGANGAGAAGASGGSAGEGGHAGVPAGGFSGAAGTSSGGAGQGGTAPGAAGGGGTGGSAGAAPAGQGGTAGVAGNGGCSGSAATCKAVIEVGLGRAHVCVRLFDGSTHCWGANASGQLGRGDTAPSAVSPGAAVPGIVAQRVSAGGDTTCVTTIAGAVSCWGDDGFGQLGRGAEVTGDARATPKAVAGLGSARTVTVGPSSVCAIETGGTVRCWGDNRAKQLGGGTTTSRTPQASVFTGDLAPSTSTIGIGAARFCGKRSPSTPLCVGGDRFQEGGADSATGLELIASISTVSEVVAGAYFGCAIQQGDATVWCWGRGDEGQLGLGGASATNRRHGAEAVPGLANATSLAAGDAHACAVLPDKTVKCWGDCSQGACGNAQAVGSTPSVPSPASVANLDNVKTIFAGGQATCALREDGTLWCWGAVAGAAATATPTQITLP